MKQFIDNKIPKERKIEVYSSKLVAWFLVVFGAGMPTVAVLAGMPWRLWKLLFVPVLLFPIDAFLSGISALIRPYFSIDENQLIFYSTFGSALQIYRFKSLKQLSIQKNNASVLKIALTNEDGKIEKITIGKLGVNSQD